MATTKHWKSIPSAGYFDRNIFKLCYRCKQFNAITNESYRRWEWKTFIQFNLEWIILKQNQRMIFNCYEIITKEDVWWIADVWVMFFFNREDSRKSHSFLAWGIMLHANFSLTHVESIVHDSRDSWVMSEFRIVIWWV